MTGSGTGWGRASGTVTVSRRAAGSVGTRPSAWAQAKKTLKTPRQDLRVSGDQPLVARSRRRWSVVTASGVGAVARIRRR